MQGKKIQSAQVELRTSLATANIESYINGVSSLSPTNLFIISRLNKLNMALTPD
jgi:hypothetical protein